MEALIHLFEKLGIVSASADNSVMVAALFSAVALIGSGLVSAYAVVRASRINSVAQRDQALKSELLSRLSALARESYSEQLRDDFYLSSACAQMLISPAGAPAEALLDHLSSCEPETSDDFLWWQRELLILGANYIHGYQKK